MHLVTVVGKSALSRLVASTRLTVTGRNGAPVAAIAVSTIGAVLILAGAGLAIWRRRA
jgi:hypothetical protein